MAEKAEDTTFGDILGYQYIDSGEFYKTETSTPDLSMSDMLKELLGTVSDTFDNSIQAISEPARIINALESGVESIEDMGENTLEALGIKDKDDEDDDDDDDDDDNDSENSNNVTGDNEESSDGTEKSNEAFGFSGLKLPSLFDFYAPNLFETLGNLPELAETLASSIAIDSANMKDKVVEFFSDIGYMTNDGDLFFNIGAQNFAWGGDGKDLFALMGTNNNVWGGKGDDVAYVIGEGNTISGNEGDDNAVFVGQNHMFIGGEGDDIGVASGRYNVLFGGTGADQLWAFGEGAYIAGNEGNDYLVSTGNYGKIYGHSGDDIGVVIGAYNVMSLGEGDDHGKVFGNKNTVYLSIDINANFCTIGTAIISKIIFN
jgi:RTX toxin RtxA